MHKFTRILLSTLLTGSVFSLPAHSMIEGTETDSKLRSFPATLESDDEARTDCDSTGHSRTNSNLGGPADVQALARITCKEVQSLTSVDLAGVEKVDSNSLPIAIEVENAVISSAIKYNDKSSSKSVIGFSHPFSEYGKVLEALGIRQKKARELLSENKNIFSPESLIFMKENGVSFTYDGFTIAPLSRQTSHDSEDGKSLDVAGD